MSMYVSVAMPIPRYVPPPSFCMITENAGGLCIWLYVSSGYAN